MIRTVRIIHGPDDDPGREYLLIGDAAEALGVTRRTVDRWIKSGRITRASVCGLTCIPVHEVEELRGVAS